MPPLTLSTDKILDGALALLDEGGADHLTMRRLADRLGVTATALYYHYTGRDQLLDALADRLCRPIADDLSSPGDWAATCRRALLNWVERAARHPRATGWAMTTYARRPPVLRIHEALLATLLDAGFTPAAALHVKGALMRFVVGHLVLDELSAGTAWRDELPPDAFPRYRSVADAVDAFDRAEHVTVGLDALLAGLAASPLAP